jgi:hypothetical protein
MKRVQIKTILWPTQVCSPATLAHRARAAFRAIAAFWWSDKEAALAIPPLLAPNLPSATAAGFFSGLGSARAITSCMTLCANWFTSLGLFRLIMPEFTCEICQNEAQNQSSPLPNYAPTAKIVPLFACSRNKIGLS